VNIERPWLFDDMLRRGYLRTVPIRDREGAVVPPGSGFVLYEIHEPPRRQERQE
jgi:hypothetical protein